MITPELVGRILNTMVEGLAVTGIVWLALRSIKSFSSSTRFALLFSTLLMVAVLPLVSHLTARDAFASGSAATFLLPDSMSVYLLIGWAVIAFALLTRLGVSLWHVRTLRQQSSLVHFKDLDPALRNIFAEATPRRVQLRISDRMRVPAALGFFRPAVVIPTWILRELPADELKVILLHEVAHLRRWDDWTNLAQKVVKALFFFHPAVWWIEGRLRLEREMACDDMVVAHTSNARGYAKSLLSLAEKVGLGRGVALAQAALGRARETSARITQILNANRPAMTAAWKPVTAMSMVAALTVLAVPYTPNLVAFENSATSLPAIVVRTTPSVSPVAFEVVKSSAPVVMKNVALQQKPAAPAMKVERETRVIQASVKKQSPPARMLLVMESVEYDSYGTAVWTLCVWQVTDRNPKHPQPPVHPETVMNSL